METRWKRLFQFISLVGILDAESVEISGAANLELGNVSGLLNLHGASILATSSKEKLLDLFNSLWLQQKVGKQSQKSARTETLKTPQGNLLRSRLPDHPRVRITQQDTYNLL